MLQITGTENEVKELCNTISQNNEYCPFMQTIIVKKCNGIRCTTAEQVLKCALKYNFITIIDK